jgi:adenylate cyclase
MQRALADLNPELVREGMPPLEMGIGINTGPVIVGNLGSEARTKYGLVGSVVNIAARIESNTLGGQVLVGESTFQLVREHVIAQPPLAVMMKGLKKPLVCYPVTAIGPPYGVSFSNERTDQPVEIRLPFQLWRLDGKKILAEIIEGQTHYIGESSLAVDLPVRLEPLTNVKLLFSFCREAHCFSDIYAKVLGVEQNGGRLLHRLGVTYMDRRDKALLSGWIETATDSGRQTTESA